MVNKSDILDVNNDDYLIRSYLINSSEIEVNHQCQILLIQKINPALSSLVRV
jgi:hypothetical protein